MRDIQLNILTLAAMLSFAAVPHLAAQKDATVGIVDFYGLRQVTEARVRQALRLVEGDTVTEATLRDAEKRLRTLSGVSDARVDGVCCDDGKIIVYVGIEEKGTPVPRFNAPPKGHARLPDEVARAGAAFDAAFENAVARGTLQEDQSQGHLLMQDPAARAVQEGFVALADRYGPQLRETLRDSDKREQRALAAQVLGYATDKAGVVADLSAAMRDADAEVRNTATRALWLIAAFAQKAPDRKIQVPADSFVDLLTESELASAVAIGSHAAIVDAALKRLGPK